MTDDEVAEVKEYFGSERMQKVFVTVNEVSFSPVTFTWFDDVTPG
jgi:hypothetical protein